MQRTRISGIYRTGDQYEVDKVFRRERIRRRGFTSLEEAEEYLIAQQGRIQSWSDRGKPGTMLFGEAATYYVQKHAVDKPTLRTDIINLRRVLPFIGGLPICEVHDDTLKPFVQHMKTAGREKSPVTQPGVRTPYKRETINKSLKMVSRILLLCAQKWRDAGGKYLLDKAPTISLLSEHDKRPPRPLLWPEQTVLMPLLPSHLAEMVLFDLQTGVREEVVCNLQWSWEVFVPEINASVFIVPREHVKGEETYIIDRVIVCNSLAQEIIERQRGKHSVYVFTYCRQKTKKTRVRIGKSRHKVQREPEPRPVAKMNNSGWQTARRKAGMPDLRVHDLRSTVATRLREAGVAKSTLREVLWHANDDITDHYSVAQVIEIHRALELIKDDSGRKNRTLDSLRREAAAKRLVFEKASLPHESPTLPEAEKGETAKQLTEKEKLARLAGIEPTTLGFGGQYSIH